MSQAPANTALRTFASTFRPRRAPIVRSEFLRGTAGAFLGITVACLAGKAIHAGPDALPFIVAPIGASAVLVFAAPASPLAQPWNAIVGNVASSLVGIAVGRLVHDL